MYIDIHIYIMYKDIHILLRLLIAMASRAHAKCKNHQHLKRGRSLLALPSQAARKGTTRSANSAERCDVPLFSKPSRTRAATELS